jgi:hypothetical protein
MAFPVVQINSTGSDTAASGAGPGSALTGTLAATHTNSTVNITDAVALGGVATDGSAVLWIATSSGRRWSAITAISGSSGAWVVTVGIAYGTTQSGATWAIGGKRATCASSAQLFKDGLVGWTIDIQTGETLIAALVVTMQCFPGPPALITSTSGTRPVITTATNSINLIDISSCQNVVFSHLSFSNTAATKGTTTANGRGMTPVSASAQRLWIDDCSFDGFEIAIDVDNVNYFQCLYVNVTRTEIKNCILEGIRTQYQLWVDDCNFHNNGSDAISLVTNGSPGPIDIAHTVFNANTGCGVNWKNTGTGITAILHLVNNTFRSNTDCGVKIATASNGGSTGTGSFLTHANNIYYGNTNDGINVVNANVFTPPINFCNGYGANGTDRVNLPVGSGDVTITASPFNSSTDSGLNSTAGGGAVCIGAAARASGASANTAGDLGAIPSGGGGGGGGAAGGVAHLAGRGGGLVG